MTKPESEYPIHSLTQVRQKVQQLASSMIDVVEEEDIRMLIEDDHLLRRYMRRKRGDVNASVEFIWEALQWRKKQNILSLNEYEFPREFYEVGGLYIYKTDLQGNVVLHVRTRLYQKIAHISELLKRFTVFMMYRANALAVQKNTGWIIVFDCTEAGLLNADLEMANFVVSTLSSYFPAGQKYVLVHNCPWFLSALRNVIFAMLPAHVRRTVKFSCDRNIHEFIDRTSLPDYMGGGEGNSVYRWMPDGLRSTLEVLKVNDDEYKKVKRYYDKVRTIVQTPVSYLN